MKKYKVTMEWRILETVEVEANDKSEAEKLALAQGDINTNFAEYYDCTIKEINKEPSHD